MYSILPFFFMKLVFIYKPVYSMWAKSCMARLALIYGTAAMLWKELP